MSENTLELRKINKKYENIVALKDVNLTIFPNEITVILGDNGSGKSTLIKALSGEIKPDSGEIIINGFSYKYLTPKKALDNNIFTVYQDLSLDLNRNSVENIFLGNEIKKGIFLDRKRMTLESKELIAMLNLKIEDLSVPSRHLSGGQRQGLAIARAVRNEAHFLLLDEPTAAMGVRESNNILKLLRDLIYHNPDICIIMICHNLIQAYEIADKINIIKNGSFVKEFIKKDTNIAELSEFIINYNRAGD